MVYDRSRQHQAFNCSLHILFFMNDLLGNSYLNCLVSPTSKKGACPKLCGIVGTHSNVSNTREYNGHDKYRNFLKPMSQITNWTDIVCDNTITELQYEKIVTLIENASTKSQKDKLTKQYGIKCRSPVRKLEGVTFSDSSNVDIMHMIFNLVCKILSLLTGEFDTRLSSEDKERMGRYRLLSEDISKLESWLVNSRVCDELSGIKPVFSKSANCTDCLQFLLYHFPSLILKIKCLNIDLNETLETLLVDLCCIFRVICSPVVEVQQMRQLYLDIIDWQVRADAYFPAVCKGMYYHSLLHIPLQCLCWGPVVRANCFGSERIFGLISRKCKQYRYPLGSVRNIYKQFFASWSLTPLLKPYYFSLMQKDSSLTDIYNSTVPKYSNAHQLPHLLISDHETKTHFLSKPKNEKLDYKSSLTSQLLTFLGDKFPTLQQLLQLSSQSNSPNFYHWTLQTTLTKQQKPFVLSLPEHILTYTKVKHDELIFKIKGSSGQKLDYWALARIPETNQLHPVVIRKIVKLWYRSQEQTLIYGNIMSLGNNFVHETKLGYQLNICKEAFTNEFNSWIDISKFRNKLIIKKLNNNILSAVPYRFYITS